jgi:hypothetical protein
MEGTNAEGHEGLRRTAVGLLRTSIPLHQHREPREPYASDDGHEPLLPRHAGKLKQHGVNPAHGGLVRRHIVGGSRQKVQGLGAAAFRDHDEDSSVLFGQRGTHLAYPLLDVKGSAFPGMKPGVDSCAQ